jgi:hypothetical protein
MLSVLTLTYGLGLDYIMHKIFWQLDVLVLVQVGTALAPAPAVGGDVFWFSDVVCFCPSYFLSLVIGIFFWSTSLLSPFLTSFANDYESGGIFFFWELLLLYWSW